MRDLTGLRFGRWTVIRKGKKWMRYQYWLCRCDCGVEREVRVYTLLNGDSKSCGCISREIKIKRNTTHGLRHNPVYSIWLSMRQRCNNPNDKAYKNYGDRGISVCKRWGIFINFYKDMGKRPKGLTLERIDNNGNYKPSNCKWATRKEQSRNKRNNRIISYCGKKQCLFDWASDLKIKPPTLRARLVNHPPQIAFNM